MIGRTNVNRFMKYEAPYNYSNLVLWLDGTDFVDHSSKNWAVTNTNCQANIIETVDGHVDCRVYRRNDNAYFGNSSAQNILTTTTYSLCMWIKPVSQVSWQGFIKMSGSSNGLFDYRQYGSNKTFGIAARDSGGNAYDFNYSDTTFVFNKWYFLSTAWNGKNRYTYLNGVQKQSVTMYYNQFTGNLNYSIGLAWDGNTNTQHCFTDIRIYNYTLSASEMLTIYQTGPCTHNSILRYS